jgi:hypothetical protein
MLCTVLDGADGRVVRPAAPMPIAPGQAKQAQPGEGYSAAVAIDGGFALAWTTNERLGPAQGKREAHLTLLTDKGLPVATRLLGGEAVRSLDLERVGTELAVAWDGPRGIEVTWLGMDGSTHRAPYALASGLLPRVTQRQGLLAVGWAEGMSKRGFVAVTDPSGAVSPRLEVGAGLQASTPTLAPTEDGFVAAYNISYGQSSYLEPLVCRSRGTDDPPDRIVIQASKP